MKRGTIVFLAIVVFGICFSVWFLSRDILFIETMKAPSVDSRAEVEDSDLAAVQKRLSDVGLHPTGSLSDLGIDDHVARLKQGQITAADLNAYADAIETLTKRSAERGQSLPPTLWDVTSTALIDSGWTVYSLTEALASEEGRIHVDLLADAYNTYLTARPNALKGALTLLPLADDYVRSLPESARAEHEAHVDTEGEAAILIWQALLTGTSRHNPITHRPLWSHGFVGHFSVTHIHQYATGMSLTPSQVWGVEGFDPVFVGPSSNTNQVEHLGISTLLQAVGHVSTTLLDAVEVLEIAVDHEDPAAAAADKALNVAVRDVLLSQKDGDPRSLAAQFSAELGQKHR